MRDRSFQVALVAHHFRSNPKEIELLIDAYGIRDNVSLFKDLTPEEVNEILNQSKVNLVLSLQEGSNRSLFEGFFAGVPGLVLKNNIGIKKDYFTSQTGRLIQEKELGRELLFFREHWVEFDPRPWAQANIAPEIATAKLNSLLKTLAHQRGEDWSKDLVAKCNCPGLRYYPDEHVGRGLPSPEDIVGYA
jgi:glycosyltransferase involved in cell wall biosynthesis